MIPVTDRFLIALKESHRVTVAATILPPDGPAAAAEVIGGQIRADRDARVRRQGSITVGFDLDQDLDLLRLLPFGGYLQIARGILYADGVVERPRIATMRVENISWSRSQGQATIELADRMAQVQDEPFPAPWVPTGLPADAVVAAVQDVFGSAIAYHVSAGGGSALIDTAYDQDRAQAIGDLASGIGAVATFDANGDFVLAPAPPDPATVEPVWQFDVGGSLVDVQENLDRSAVRNGVAVRGTGDASLPPIISLAVDNDPTSPTLWGGPFGKVALIVSSTSVQTQAQADSTAASLLNLRLGLARTVTLRGVPNPALEPDDVVLAVYPDGREEPLRINSLSLPLEPTGPIDVVATGHYRPATLARRRSRNAIRVLGGGAAWRELAGARKVTA